MAKLVQIDSAAGGYHRVLDTLLREGRTQESRNGKTLEIEDLVIELADPERAIIGKARPQFNEAIGAVEGLQLIAGISDASLTCEIQPNFRAFTDDGELYGAYGPRTVGQFPVITERLRIDPDTRQAIVTIWNPEFDAAGGKKDHPCTTAFNFRIRSGKLNMTTFMRSNDAYWGWVYDVYQFCMVQLTLANVLGVQPGTYTHHAASFHLYEQHWDVAHDIVEQGPYVGEIDNLVGFGGNTWDDAREEARTVWHVVRGVLPVSLLETDEQLRFADTLIRRKWKTVGQTLEKIGTRVTGQ